MAIFRCKMCGGDLEVVEGTSYCTCEFCGRQQTIPTVTDEGLQTLFNRANVLRMKSEFDKAADVYEKILQRSDTEAEAYWGLILCKYGIEYVEDPASFKRVPTCHRASYDAVTADEDYQSALKYADPTQRSIYETEAAAIDEIQRGIIALAQKEDPYDVFICYKETDADGKRTQDSVIANDVYHQLTMEGFKVFYAAITLEDKLGTEYEPYIFSALNTAKVMLALGTKPEYFSAVWVKNEWSRFLKIMQKDRSKLLIPCYRDMDPYELPEEFAHLQAQDMGKIGFINDLVRGIKKVAGNEETTAASVAAVATASESTANVVALLKRGKMALEDSEWDKADEFFERALDLDAELEEAYLGKMMAKFRLNSLDAMHEDVDYSQDNNWKRAKQFAGEKTLALMDAQEKKHIEYLRKKEEERRQLEEEKRREEARIAEEKRLAAEKLEFRRSSFLKLLENYSELSAKTKEFEHMGLFKKAEKEALYKKILVLKENCEHIESTCKEILEEFGITMLDGQVLFGNYKERPITWKILDIDNTGLLVIASEALFKGAYDLSKSSISWESSSLRKWLNESFRQSSFNQKESDMINGDITILGESEAKKYFPKKENRECTLRSEHKDNKSGNNCTWWLRTVTSDRERVLSVNAAGEIDQTGYFANYDGYAIRPAMWIDIG